MNTPVPFGVFQMPCEADPLTLPVNVTTPAIAQTVKSFGALTSGFAIIFTFMLSDTLAHSEVEGEVKVKLTLVMVKSLTLKTYVAVGLALPGRKIPVPLVFHVPVVKPETLPFNAIDCEFVQTKVPGPALTAGGSTKDTVKVFAVLEQPNKGPELVNVSVMLLDARSAGEGV